MAFVTDRFHDNNLHNPVQLTDEEIDNVVKNMDRFCISKFCNAIECELSINGDFSKLAMQVIKCWKNFIKVLNDDNSGDAFFANPKFVKESIDVKYGEKNKGLQVIDSYYEDIFTVSFTSPRNTFFFDDNNDPDLDSYVNFAIVPTQETLELRYNNSFQLKDDDQQLPLELEFDNFDDDFIEVFNVGDEIYQNSIDYITRFHRKLEFKNLWDRHTC